MGQLGVILVFLLSGVGFDRLEGTLHIGILRLGGCVTFLGLVLGVLLGTVLHTCWSRVLVSSFSFGILVVAARFGRVCLP